MIAQVIPKSKLIACLVNCRFMKTITHCERSLSTATTNNINKETNTIQSILQNVQNGKIHTMEAEALLSNLSNDNSNNTNNSDKKVLESYANIDHDRASRAGFPEAVFSQGKTPEQIVSILDNMAEYINTDIMNEKRMMMNDGDKIIKKMDYNSILATRCDSESWEAIQKLPVNNGTLTYHSVSKIVTMHPSQLVSVSESSIEDPTILDVAGGDNNKINYPKIIVACAGTTDVPIAEEAAITLQSSNRCQVERVYDVGVAGLHRILNALPKLRDPDVKCIIVCAGMDGALPSVVAGLVKVPVIAVPTSIGYGACFGGVSALLTMLNSCAPGVAVVNIDNGFGAAALAFKCIQDHNKTA